MSKKEEQKLNGKFLAYVRVSSRDQALGLSLDVQREQIEKYAKEKDLKIDKFFGGVESASQTGREEFGEMLQLLKKEKYQGIIFHKVDRSGRNPSDQGKLYEFMEEGHEFHFVVEHLSTREHTGRLTLYLMWAVASGYSENLKIEVNKGITGLLKSGRYPNPAPLGYTNAGRGVKELDPKLAPLIRKAFVMYATGNYDIITIQKKLTELGLTNKKGQPLKAKSLYHIFRTPFYYGSIQYNGQVYVGVHEPIVDKALFDKVQEVMNKKSFKHKRKLDYVFSGLLYCRVCGRPLRSISAKGRYKYYVCRNLDCKCNIREQEIDEVFISALQNLEFDEKEVAMFLRAVAAFRNDLKLSKENELQNINMELGKVRDENERLLDLYLNKKIDDSEFKLVKSKLANKELELRERRQALEKADNKTMDDIAEIGKLLKKPSQVYRMASEEKKRFLVKSLLENFSWSGGKLIIHWQKQYKAIAERPRNSLGRAAGN